MSIFTEELLVLDYIVLIFSCVLVIFSFWKGFVSSILGLLTWVGSIFITIYTYSFLSEFFYNLLLNIEFLSDFKQFVSTISFIISVPLIFLISLFLLKRIRKILNNDLDKQILGVILDKFFGAVYGILFTYIILSSLLFFTNNNNFSIINNFNIFLNENSNILKIISDNNQSLINMYTENDVN